MQYDIIGGTYQDDEEVIKPLTIGKLLEVCKDNKKKEVIFLGGEYTIGELGSWRGSYGQPAFIYNYGTKTGAEIYKEVKAALKETHWGYKGGEYKYTENDEFYVSAYGKAEEYKVVKVEIDENYVILYTKIIPW